MIISTEQAVKFIRASEALRKAVAEAARVMEGCPRCEKNGTKAKNQIWKALDAYEPAIKSFIRSMERCGVEYDFRETE